MTHTTAAPIAHFDLAGPDLATLSHFYTAVFDWTIDPKGPGYAQVATPGLRGALVEQPERAVTLGVTVADLAQALHAAVGAGGTVTMPATDNGWVTKAQVCDPAGNPITLIQR